MSVRKWFIEVFADVLRPNKETKIDAQAVNFTDKQIELGEGNIFRYDSVSGNYQVYKDPNWVNIDESSINPMTTRGDIIYKNASNVTDRLALGKDGYVPRSDGDDLIYSGALNDLLSNYTNQLIYGTVTWNSLLIFDVSDCAYYIQGVRYESSATQVTLATADATLDRIDVIYVDDTGAVGKITGTPGATPAKPIVDPVTQLELTSISVPAGSTVPGGISADLIYDENTEWTTSATEPTNVSVDFDSLVSPKSGSKCILIENTVGGNITGAIATFTKGSDTTVGGKILSFYIRTSADFNKKSYIKVSLLDGATTIRRVSIGRKNIYGFDTTIVDTWQKIAIPLDDMPSGGTADEINIFQLEFIGTWDNTLEIGLDYIDLQNGIIIPPQISYNLLTQNDENRTSYNMPIDDASNITSGGFYRAGSLTGSMPYTGAEGTIIAMYNNTGASGLLFLFINSGDDSISVSHDKGTTWTAAGSNLLTNNDEERSLKDIPSDDCQDIVSSGLYKVTTSTTNGPVSSKDGIIIANYRSATANDIYLFYLNEDGDFYISVDLAQNWATVGGGSSPLTTKGDLWGYNTADVRVPIGSNNKYLIADSSEALGLRWGDIFYSSDGSVTGDYSGETTIFASSGSLTNGAVVYISGNNAVANADANGTGTYPAIGIVVDATTKKIMTRGYYTNTSWSFTANDEIYLDTTAGAVTTTAPGASADAVQLIGRAVDANTIKFDFKDGVIILK